MKKEYWYIILAGALIGLAAIVLEFLGNPPNMGFCIACFERDIAGAIGLHRAAVVQYLRPEIVGIFMGALLISLFNREYKGRGGSAPALRFFIGMFVMIGALVFLGCPLRMTIRLGSGDFNAIYALLGFATGIIIGIQFLKAGFNMGRANITSKGDSVIFPIVMLILLALIFIVPVVNADAGGPLFYSVSGPGSMTAPIMLALIGGLAVGIAAQRTRICMVGGIRDVLLVKDYYLLTGFLAILVVVFIGKVATGNFNPGFAGQPIAHTQALWNFSGMLLAGLGSTFLGGCPLRQLILAGSGNTDSAVAVTGMIVGAGIAHNFLFAATPNGVAVPGQIAVVGGLAILLLIGYLNLEK